MTEPLSPERLAKIREDFETYRRTPNNASFYWAAADSAADVPDLLAEVERLNAQMAIVNEFLADRAQLVRTLRQCVDADADYHRWQGHAEARRVLSHLLGLPVVWPDEDKQDGPAGE